MTERKTKVLVVGESGAPQLLLGRILDSDPQIEVIGVLNNGRDAVQFLMQNKADVVLMDVEMPQTEGLAATRRIMEVRPVPIVVCGGGAGQRETPTTLRSMEAGAVACIEKPSALDQRGFGAAAENLLRTLKLMAEVKVVRRWPRARCEVRQPRPPVPTRTPAHIDLIGIGASTGGPPVLQTILAALPADFAVPILIVQHIAPGFVAGLASWLTQTTGCDVHVAVDGVSPVPGRVYLAPDDFHMSVRPGGLIALTSEPPEAGLRPSVAHLFNSVCNVYGRNSAGVLLTGMGKDGAEALWRMKDCGAITVAQDRQSSAVFGMPGEAVARRAATYVLPPEQIVPVLVAASRQHTFPERGLA